jgi:hypothetical protein
MIEEVAGFLYTEETGMRPGRRSTRTAPRRAHRVRALAALEAITPMIEKLLKDQREQIAKALEDEADQDGEYMSHYATKAAAQFVREVEL